ncbi:MAG: glucokinase [Rickettsiales bacterium]
MAQKLNLVADIGGTNSRFALCEPGSLQLIEPQKHPNRNFTGLAEAIAYYLTGVNAKPANACVAVAGPITGDTVRLTNIAWEFSIAEMARNFNLRQLHIANDFTALAMSVPYEPENNIVQIGSGEAVPNQAMAVLGPGTGLGVSGLLWSGTGWVPIAGEGGNARFTPHDAKEAELLAFAWKKIGRIVRTEDFVSGLGMTFLHSALLEISGKELETLKAEDINRRAVAGDAACKETVRIFCGMLGAFASDVAMMLGARSGVYLGGGVTPQMRDLFETSPFRERFEDKGRFTNYVKDIPTYMLLSHSQAALHGAAAILKEKKL